MSYPYFHEVSYSPGSHKKVNFRCPTCGATTIRRYSTCLNTSVCAQCSKSTKKVNNQAISFTEAQTICSPGSHRLVLWTCPNCAKDFTKPYKQAIKTKYCKACTNSLNRESRMQFQKISGNPFKGKQHSIESLEKMRSLQRARTAHKLGYYDIPRIAIDAPLGEEISKLVNTEIVFNSRSIIPPLELDLYLPEHKLAIEYNGLFWHSEVHKEPRYHFNKFQRCKDLGIKLLTVWEFYWLERRSVVMNLIKAHLGQAKRVYARKCELCTDQKQLRDFVEANHIQGAHPNHRLLGLTYNGALVMAVSWGKHHRGKGHPTVLSRVCFADSRVVGGLDKLLRHLPRPLVTWSDNCYAPEPSLYSNAGFRLDQVLNPDYFYTTGSGIYYSKQSQMKHKTNCPVGRTEAEWCAERGLYRVWDCGKIRWVLD